MAKRLTAKAIKYAMTQLEKGRSVSEVAVEIGVTPRHVRRLLAKFRITGTSHVPQQPGRPEQRPSVEEIQLVLDEYERAPQGVTRVAMNLRVNHDISYQKVYRIMKDNGLVISSTAKSRKRKWVRFERKHSNSLWHTDWHSMKDPRMKGLNLVTFLDDASRCVTGVGLFTEATSKNVVSVLIDAIAKFGTPAAILSDNGSCFVGAGGRHSKDKDGKRTKVPSGSWQPTTFEAELLDRDVVLIDSRPYRPQTNGKIERFHRTLEEEIKHYKSLAEYIEYYNERRLHWSLDIQNRQTPLMAFHDKQASETIRSNNPDWAEEDADD